LGEDIASGGGVSNPLACVALDILVIHAAIVVRASVAATRGRVTAPIRKTGAPKTTVGAMCVATTPTARTVAIILMITTTTTKVCAIDTWSKFIIIGRFRGRSLYATDARKDLADVRTTIFLKPQSQAHKTEVGREIAIVVRVEVSLNTGLE
jgi:hypothetical protein